MCAPMMLEMLRGFQGPVASAAEVDRRLQTWYHTCDGAAPLHKKHQLNEMHVVGAKLCCDMDRCELCGYETYDVIASLGAVAPMPFTETLVCRLDWQQLTDMMSTLQLEYKRLLMWNDTTGWATCFDYRQFMLCVLKRVGFWARHEWRLPVADAGERGDAGHAPGADALATPDTEAMQGAVEIDAAGWRKLAPSTLAALLDAVHSFAALTNRLLSATVVADADASTRVELRAHHREASLDEYYVTAMVADLPVGSILQYAHRFQFLFHSITQVDTVLRCAARM